jgi:ubiquinone/menaquinone biosynthesis C-methylase UbiE
VSDCDPWGAAAEVRTADRWRSAAANWGRAVTDALLAAADLHQDSVVLDVAAGSGDPALSIARRLIEGRVVALDSSRSGLLLAKRQADMGLASRLRFVQADVHKLPFSDFSFDRVTCRCGIMFFADVDAALGETLRVLKLSGQAAFLAWGRFEQPFFENTIGVILRLIPGTTVPEQARAMFKFGTHGALQNSLLGAGFRNVQEQHLTLTRTWAGSPQQLWQYFQEISTLFHPLIEAIPAAARPHVDAAATAALGRFKTGNMITVPAQVVLATGGS